MPRRDGSPNDSFEKLKHAAAQARLPFDRDVWLNVAFYLDEQYVEWNDDIKTLRTIGREPRQLNTPRPVANKMMHFASQLHAQALQDEPTYDVMPATDNPIDIGDTSVANAYLQWFVEPQVASFEHVNSQAALWAIVGGEAFLKWIYNPRLKRPDVIACSPLDIFPDPYATDFAKCRYIIHSQFMDVEQVYELYGKEVRPNDMAKADPIRSQLLQQMGSAPMLSGAVVNELWMRPCRRYKDGLYCVWTSDEQLVAPDDLPYEHLIEDKKLPFTQLGVIPRPGSLHYSSPLKYMRSGQMELNKYHAQKISIREAFANPKWWIPQELELETQPDDSPRQILTGNSNQGMLKPEIIQPTGMPDNGDGEWIVQELMNIVGQHEVSQAQVPGRVEAAKAIALLKESDTTRLSELNRTMKASIGEGMYQVLMLAKQFVPSGTIVQTYSPEGLPEVKRFKKDAIKPGMRIRITMGTGLASSRAARQDQLMLLWQNGVIKDPETMARLMDVPLPTFIEARAYDIKLARNENLDIAAGNPIKPNSWDEHELHLREHNSFRKTAEYLLLDNETKQMFEFHCSQHDELFIQQAGKQIMKAQMAMQAAQAMAAIPPAGAPDDINQQAQAGQVQPGAPPQGPTGGQQQPSPQ